MYNFKRLINKYSKLPVYRLIETDGYYDIDNGNIWVDGDIAELVFDGAIVPLSNEELNFGEGGTYTTEDRKLYCYEDLEKGSKILHKEKDYTVMNEKDYEDFDKELRIYILKRGGRAD